MLKQKCAKKEAKMCKEASKDATKTAQTQKAVTKEHQKAAKMDASALEVYSTYTPRGDASIFAAAP